MIPQHNLWFRALMTQQTMAGRNVYSPTMSSMRKNITSMIRRRVILAEREIAMVDGTRR